MSEIAWLIYAGAGPCEAVLIRLRGEDRALVPDALPGEHGVDAGETTKVPFPELTATARRRETTDSADPPRHGINHAEVRRGMRPTRMKCGIARALFTDAGNLTAPARKR